MGIFFSDSINLGVDEEGYLLRGDHLRLYAPHTTSYKIYYIIFVRTNKFHSFNHNLVGTAPPRQPETLTITSSLSPPLIHRPTRRWRHPAPPPISASPITVVRAPLPPTLAPPVLLLGRPTIGAGHTGAPGVARSCPCANGHGVYLSKVYESLIGPKIQLGLQYKFGINEKKLCWIKTLLISYSLRPL
jgi:hypothetical protein